MTGHFVKMWEIKGSYCEMKEGRGVLTLESKTNFMYFSGKVPKARGTFDVPLKPFTDPCG